MGKLENDIISENAIEEWGIYSQMFSSAFVFEVWLESCDWGGKNGSDFNAGQEGGREGVWKILELQERVSSQGK